MRGGLYQVRAADGNVVHARRNADNTITLTQMRFVSHAGFARRRQGGQPLVVNESKVLEMLRTHSQADVARHFGVTPPAISAFIRRHRRAA